jgi:hypothetical protein
MRNFFRSLAGTDIARDQPRSWHRDRRRPEILLELRGGVGDCGTTILVANGPKTRASRLDRTEQCEDVREDEEEGPFGACCRNT